MGWWAPTCSSDTKAPQISGKSQQLTQFRGGTPEWRTSVSRSCATRGSPDWQDFKGDRAAREFVWSFVHFCGPLVCCVTEASRPPHVVRWCKISPSDFMAQDLEPHLRGSVLLMSAIHIVSGPTALFTSQFAAIVIKSCAAPSVGLLLQHRCRQRCAATQTSGCPPSTGILRVAVKCLLLPECFFTNLLADGG